MIFPIRPWLMIALTILVVLAVYFQSISHPFSRFDDLFILEYYGNNSTLSFLDVITPGSGFYFRPLINLSFWLDSRLWGLDPTFMHLENIVVHLVNVLLVYIITSQLPITSKIKRLPLISALLFGLHPINSESVNWIAGRTDVYAGTFVFFAVYCLIRAIQEHSTRFAYFAFGIAFVGSLAKETAIMFIPAAFLVFMYWPVMLHNGPKTRGWHIRFLLIPSVISSSLVAILLILVYVKRRGENVLSLLLEGGADIFIRSFEAFGFYVKKFFLPLPLNVAIREVDPLYVIVGIVTLCVVVIILRRLGIIGIFFSLAVLFTLPALVVAITPIAWTPYGERYLYIPSAFAIIGSLELSYRFFAKWDVVRWFERIFIIIIAVASIVTFQRGILWGDNLALIEDIVAKSPDFGVARNEYGALLIEAGRYHDAEKQFKIALNLKNQDSATRIIRNNLIGVKMHGKTPNEARGILLNEIGNKANGDIELLKLLYKCDESILVGKDSLENKNKILAEMHEINDDLYLKTNEPHYLYRSGQLALSYGDKQVAAAYFRKAYEKARPDAFYSEPARILAEKLGTK